MTTKSGTARSVYMARLRRAFLLRVHPDRFRSASVRAQQARLVQALSHRLGQPDFVAWQQQLYLKESLYATTAADAMIYPFVLEKRDGSFLQTAFRMNASVESILSTIVQNLKQVGASLPEPPPAVPDSVMSSKSRKRARPTENASSYATHNTTNSSYNTTTSNAKGRHLQHFLSNLQPDEIQQRRNSRVDAQAAALAVRRLYRFQAVDATSLGWSSAWVATLFRRLLDLHNDSCYASFYPIRLVFSNSAAKVCIAQSQDPALDVHGGVLRLSPAGTLLQWREALGSVTQAQIQEIQYHQARMLVFSRTIHSALGLKVKKGHSCSNVDYSAILKRLSQSLDSGRKTTTPMLQQSSSLSPKPLILAIESPQMCRRPIVTQQGQLRLGAHMDTTTVLRSVTELGPVALQYRDQHETLVVQQKDYIQQAQYQLGLQNVYATAAVSPIEFGASLERLLARSNKESSLLGGHSLGIAGSDRFCHLADDGSVVIPHNWV